MLADNPTPLPSTGWEDRHCWLPRRPGHEGHGRKGQPEGRCRAAYEEDFLKSETAARHRSEEPQS